VLVGIFSDTHDNLTQITRALEVFRRQKVQTLLHAGDIVSPFAAKTIKTVNLPLYIIYGNNDGERAGLRKLLPQIADGPIEVMLDDRRVVMAHDFSDISADMLARADVLVAGHTHMPLVESKQGKLWINPGECCGWVNGRSTLALLETDGLRGEIVDLPWS